MLNDNVIQVVDGKDLLKSVLEQVGITAGKGFFQPVNDGSVIYTGTNQFEDVFCPIADFGIIHWCDYGLNAGNLVLYLNQDLEHFYVYVRDNGTINIVQENENVVFLDWSDTQNPIRNIERKFKPTLKEQLEDPNVNAFVQLVQQTLDSLNISSERSTQILKLYFNTLKANKFPSE